MESLSPFFIWASLPVVAGYVAHKKGRPWLHAAFLALLMPTVGVAIVFLQSPHPIVSALNSASLKNSGFSTEMQGAIWI